ncbi:TPA: XTP/dITP diphosphatase [bacterium]|nr:XTP/dITP diphosphatase [bacterium]
MSKDLVLATRNKKKLIEIRELLEGLDFNVLSIDDFDGIPEILEDADTFEGNATKKAVEIFKATGKLALADDSGLEIDYLGGKPGVYSARFAGENATDEDRYRKVLFFMQGVPKERRTARFKCAVAIAYSETPVIVTGVCEGEIATEPKGDHGFGYDPIFIVPSYNKTFAELGAEIKNKISHRAIALEKAKRVLIDYLHTLK